LGYLSYIILLGAADLMHQARDAVNGRVRDGSAARVVLGRRGFGFVAHGLRQQDTADADLAGHLRVSAARTVRAHHSHTSCLAAKM